MASVVWSSVSAGRILRNFTQFKSFTSFKRHLGTKLCASQNPSKYRCDAVEKLIEINNKFNLVKPGYKVLDIGAAPGSWSQFLADKTNSHEKDSNLPVGSVIAIDVEPFDNIEGVVTLPGKDFFSQDSQNEIVKILGKGEKLDVILCDMLPTVVGATAVDYERFVKFSLAVLLFVVTHLKEGGSYLIKLLDYECHNHIQKELKMMFDEVSFPLGFASAKPQSDIYILGKNFKGLRNAS